MNGIVVSFEGLDGVGKSTLAYEFQRHVQADLRFAGRVVKVTSDLAGTALGMQLKLAILDDSVALAPWTELHLFLAVRAHLVDYVLRPLVVQRDAIVIMDRFVDSTVAYQGYGRQLPWDIIDRLNEEIVGPQCWPAVTFLIDGDPVKLAQERRDRGAVGDNIERESPEFYQRVRRGYDLIQNRNSHRIRRIERGNQQETFYRIMREWEIFLADPAAFHHNIGSPRD